MLTTSSRCVLDLFEVYETFLKLPAPLCLTAGPQIRARAHAEVPCEQIGSGYLVPETSPFS